MMTVGLFKGISMGFLSKPKPFLFAFGHYVQARILIWSDGRIRRGMDNVFVSWFRVNRQTQTY